MADETTFTVRLTQDHDYQFRVGFDSPEMASLLVDEPAPLGKNEGPNAARLVAAAVANCLSASLLFAVRKFKQDPGTLQAEAVARIARNEQGRFRIAGIDVAIQLGGASEGIEHLDRSLAQFEDFCIVTQSIRHGIPVHVEVKDAAGRVVHQG
ncbi:MAG: OsmC family protein [Burkholderiales bacterium]